MCVIELTPKQEIRLRRFEGMRLCENCPTCLGLGEEDDYIVYWFPTRGESKKIKAEVSWICPTCSV